jgi:hypothetical protein
MQQGKLEVALNLLREGLPADLVQKATGLDAASIQTPV